MKNDFQVEGSDNSAQYLDLVYSVHNFIILNVKS